MPGLCDMIQVSIHIHGKQEGVLRPMERSVPETVNEGIELYIRTYYSLLRSSGEVRIRSLEETHEGMLSSLHLRRRWGDHVALSHRATNPTADRRGNQTQQQSDERAPGCSLG